MSIKQVLTLIMSLALLAALCGCEQPPAETQPDADGYPPVAAELLMATGDMDGSYYAYGNVLAQAVIGAGRGVTISVEGSESTDDSLLRLLSGEIQLAIVQGDALHQRYTGDVSAAQQELQQLQVIAALYPEVCQLIAAADAGISTAAELSGKRVGTGSAGSATAESVRQILAAYQLDAASVQTQALGFGEAAQALTDQQLDAFFAVSAAPNNAVSQLAARRAIVIVPLEGAQIEALIAEYPYYQPQQITPAEYAFLSAPVNSIAVWSMLVCSADLAEDVAYVLTRAMFEQQAAIVAGHAKGVYLDAEAAVRGSSIELHPGARKYYEEIGVL
ncbi:MAG: TAXI family TRAP transporter solute-binding subunit [Bacillota bacterium]|nr:TAXI family TRAP transporter solute-binding subunit [Bacillota bacterium]